MPDVGAELGVDCYQLFVAGFTHLPAIAKQLRNVVWDLNDSARADRAYVRSDVLQTGMWGQGYAPLAELRQLLTDMLTAEEIALLAAGEALVTAAAEYERSDTEARDVFQSLLRGPGHGRY